MPVTSSLVAVLVRGRYTALQEFSTPDVTRQFVQVEIVYCVLRIGRVCESQEGVSAVFLRCLSAWHTQRPPDQLTFIRLRRQNNLYYIP